ncbi:MAG: tryptophan--tRNA ligase [Chlamydiae bacterium]|jgi:tryptophanyl-tRNA synthetase|nr:tryptophan--tRNA ligase [Chlamydiota bacterium]
MTKKTILTGDRPTGRLHLGHYVGSLKSRVDLQHHHDQFVMIADAQALTDHASEPKKIREHVYQVALDYLACGIEPKLSTIFIQSQIPQLPELAMYFLNLVTWNRLKHNPTVKAEINQKGFGESVPAGFMTYPIFQAADITAFHADLVPVGEDQKPMIEQTNEIVRSFNRIYQTTCLKEVEAVIPKIARLPGTDGGEKMGKTLGNAIFLSDPIDEVAKKVKKMYTDPNHLKVEDPGQVEGNPVFIYLDAFGKDLEKIEELKAHYARGGLGDSIVKKYLLDVLVEFLEPIQKRRQLYENNLPEVKNIIKEGTLKAQIKAEGTLKKVKEVMYLNYE